MSRSSFPPPTEEVVLPILPLRNSILFPAVVVPVNVGRSRSVELIEQVWGDDRPIIGVVAQRRPDIEDPRFEDLYLMGTIARIVKVIRLGPRNYSVVLQGAARMRIMEGVVRDPYLRGRILRVPEFQNRDEEIDALTAHLRAAASELATVAGPSTESMTSFDNVRDPGALADLVAATLPIGTELKQSILEAIDLRARLRSVLEHVQRQHEIHRVKKEVTSLVEQQMSRSQRELLLREQIKTIRRELGEQEDEDEEIDALRDRLARAELPTEADKAAKKQLSRMRSMAPTSSEYQIARTYVEWIADLPWNRVSPQRLEIAEARRVLDEDHHGLELVKKRILEFLAVRKLRPDARGPILCFVGPPGVGKTSLARSIARATGRRFVRIALGGVNDEAEVRGHRRTYIGAYPGRIIAGLKKATALNPVMLLDEIDKLGRDHRGDPGSALLEVLDPEQNREFVDHYLGIPVDLSQVMFIATANRLDTIPGPLLDRMETIELSGYTHAEKAAILRQFLVPKQLRDHGLSPERLDFGEDALDCLVDQYADEAGVRKLEQHVGAICRSVAVKLAHGEDVHLVASADYVRKVLGPHRGRKEEVERAHVAGVCMTLAWTPSGGDVVTVEATRMQGSGRIHTTGQMDDVMKESVAAALTYIRTRTLRLGLPEDFFSKVDLHIHLPRGELKKEGPSAGLAILVAVMSMLTRVRVPGDVAFTGEVTLRGNVLRVRQFKEKCLAAHRSGIRELVAPRANQCDLDLVPKEVRAGLSLRFVHRIDEVFDYLLGAVPGESAAAPTTL